MAWYLIRHSDNFTFLFLTEGNISLAGTDHIKLLIDRQHFLRRRTNVGCSLYKNGSRHTTSACMENNANLKVK